MLHLTGQIESAYLDRDLGFIHEAPAQLAMLQAVSKAAFRIRNPETALATLREAHRLAFTAPCGPVSIEILIDIQASLLDLPADMAPLAIQPIEPLASEVHALAEKLATAKRPLLWLGGGACGAGAEVERFVKMGWGVVTSVRRRGILAEDHPASLGSYNLQKPADATLKNEFTAIAGRSLWWVRDITLSNSTWGNRAPMLDHPRAGAHALDGGIGQGLAMAIGASIANKVHQLGCKTVALISDGGFMLLVGELACALQEQADIVMLVMNDSCYGVIKNIQDDIYGGRHCYVNLHTPDFAQFCASLKVTHFRLSTPAEATAVLQQAIATSGPVVVEVDMKSWGPFAAKFAGPIVKKD